MSAEMTSPFVNGGLVLVLAAASLYLYDETRATRESSEWAMPALEARPATSRKTVSEPSKRRSQIPHIIPKDIVPLGQGSSMQRDHISNDE